MRIGVDATDEGTFENGKWTAKRTLNGNEVHASTWSGTGSKLSVNKVSIQKTISLFFFSNFFKIQTRMPTAKHIPIIPFISADGDRV